MPSRTTATPYERVGELEALIQQAVDIQKIWGGLWKCLFKFPSGVACDKDFSVRYELKRHLRAHLGIRPHVCMHCTAARDAWTLLGCNGKEPCIYTATQKHNLTTHIERVHKSQVSGLAPYPSEISSTAHQNLSASDVTSWGGGPQPMVPQVPMNTYLPAGEWARSVTPREPVYEARQNMPPFYILQELYPKLDSKANPSVAPDNCPTCSSPNGCICHNTARDVLAAHSGQKIPFGGQGSGFYSSEGRANTGGSADSSLWGHASGPPFGAYATPSSSGQFMFPGDLAHSPAHHTLGGYPGDQGPFSALSPQTLRQELYSYRQIISRPSPQYAGASYPAASNDLGLLFSSPFDASQPTTFEGVDLWNADDERTRMQTSHVRSMSKSSTADEHRAIRNMNSHVDFTFDDYSELAPLTIDHSNQ